MKNDQKMFILIEGVLGVIVFLLALFMLLEKNGREMEKVSVIVQDSDDEQWAAFKYGLKMAAKDNEIEIFVVNTDGLLSVEEQKALIENEAANGADAVIVQPVWKKESVKMLKEIEKKIPVMLIEAAVDEEGKENRLPITQPDYHAMGQTLAEELLEDYSGNIAGKKIGILAQSEDSQAAALIRQGVKESLKDEGAVIHWELFRTFGEDEKRFLNAQPKVDFLLALDDSSLRIAGECAAGNDLQGALIYGIGHSMEAFYYLDIGIAQCLVVPDEFSAGYQSLTEIAEFLRCYFHRLQDEEYRYTVIRKEELFLQENQEILFTMSQ